MSDKNYDSKYLLDEISIAACLQEGLIERVMADYDLFRNQINYAVETDFETGEHQLEAAISAIRAVSKRDLTDYQLGLVVLATVRNLNGYQEKEEVPEEIPEEAALIQKTSVDTRILELLERADSIPISQRLGFAAELKGLTKELKEHRLGSKVNREYLLDKVVELETNYRNQVWDEVFFTTSWRPSYDKIKEIVKGEFEEQFYLSEYPLEPKITVSAYENGLIKEFFPSNQKTMIGQVELSKHQIMSAAFSILESKVRLTIDIDNLTLEDWEAAIKESMTKSSSQKWDKVYRLARKVDQDFFERVKSLMGEETEVCKKIATDIAKMVRVIPGNVSFSTNPKSIVDLEEEISRVTEEYSNRDGFFMKVNKSSPIRIKGGIYWTNHQSQSYDKGAYVHQFLNGQNDGAFVKSRTTFAILSLSELSGLVEKSFRLKKLSFEEVLKEQRILDSLSNLKFKDVLLRYHPECEKEFKSRDAYNNIVMNRFKSEETQD